MPLENRYGVGLVNSELVAQARSRSIESRFADTPENVCWILPELDIKKIDGNFIQEWADTGEPRIIFLYRDPRGVILSMVNFLPGKTAAGFGNGDLSAITINEEPPRVVPFRHARRRTRRSARLG